MSDTPPQEPVEGPEPEPEDWLPPLLLMADYDHKWEPFNEAAYARFRADFVASQPLFRGYRVACRRDPMTDGKEFGYWHCTSEDRTKQGEAEREPDIRRLERVGWVRAIIQNADSDDRIDVWSNVRNGYERHLIWFNEEYLVILEWRRNQRYWQLVTAYTVDREHQRKKLRQERDAAKEQA